MVSQYQGNLLRSSLKDGLSPEKKKQAEGDKVLSLLLNTRKDMVTNIILSLDVILILRSYLLSFKIKFEKF